MTNTPAEFWNILGVVETVDAPGRKATVSDEQGIIHPIVWAPGYLDEKFAKLKPGYYRKFSGETGKPGVTTALGYMGKDDPEWVKARYKALHPSGGSGGYRGQPRNEKAIILQCCMKVAGEVFVGCLGGNSNGQSYEATMERITVAAKKAAAELCTAAGVQ
jgi:hypothetical protein